jgi:hypothetical protein
MSDIRRFDFDARIHYGVIHGGALYLTGQSGTPGKSAANQMREVLGKIDLLLPKAGTDKPRILPSRCGSTTSETLTRSTWCGTLGCRGHMREHAGRAKDGWPSRECWSS